ncbi:exodeoxyribonuclease VII large subunit [Pelotomaculum propionicicum]|uniref:Exodeoxyribonuclease 7 large subunit n=1 Tax=Pelotomaculum propionicicum TaxID=258475 RepID=A0A4Y7RMS1_9FIRM|nr:exodeoxyribonuclease VII large subunit [Pelotomaculum propionicicum]NLI14035.1 exodeoxyribonuclease VII large subunit [Peptococcaceae bacterium]TEB10039.1 Exodeoxyribonuclease 7 large subunit [Pelotomaculum propionicicum]
MRILTVQELNQHIKTLLEKDYLLANVWVKGEISNFKAATSGHFYFTLKDNYSCLRVVMFRSRSRSLLFRPENGMAVTVRGYVSLYERDGAYQLYAEEMEPDGTGALYLAFEQLKERLQKEGLFDPGHKKPLPLLPKRIGIVTSPTGAAVRDLVEIIRRRWPGLEIVLVPVLVQGESAPPDVARGVQLLNKLGGVDLIIVGRGGGSLEELWAFNTEIVARSIYNSKIPVISAVGHETDITISDFVADKRAATPSAAAELAVPDKREMTRHVQSLKTRLYRAANDKVKGCGQRLAACMNNRHFTRPLDVFCGSRQQSLDFLLHRLNQGVHSSVGGQEKRLAVLAGRLQTLSPLSTLARGYSICTTPDGNRVVQDTDSVEIGARLSVRLHRGLLHCVVENKNSDN